MTQAPDDTAPDPCEEYESNGSEHLIIGLGASAGGLQAYQSFFKHMPEQSGMSFVLVQHLDPTHPSMLSELLSRRTSLPVRQVEHGVTVEPDHVYVIPPNHGLQLADGHLELTEIDRSAVPPAPIDQFFESLAVNCGTRAVGVVLSGTGSDGSRGLRALKEHGGLTIAQAEASAQYGGMPRSAVETGFVDHVLPVEQIPEHLVNYARHVDHVRRTKGLDGLQEEAEGHLQEIFRILNHQTGHDFSEYKRNTILRRVQRRIQVRQLSSAGHYVGVLSSEPDEAEALFHDLLIGVTRFFRDPDAFEALDEKVLRELFQQPGDRTIRLWVPGCATGEEAYSLAILANEAKETFNYRGRVQVFATDIDQVALVHARSGYYADSAAADIPQEYRSRYFTPSAHGLRVSRFVRDMCIFSIHNVIDDPPFSRLDLVSCRNLLIYLDSSLQRRVLTTFHYALQPEGSLFLGPSEGIAAGSDLFATVDKSNRIFRPKDVVARPPLPFATAFTTRSGPAPAAAVISRQPPGMVRLAEQALLDEYAPASVVVNDENQVVHFIGRTGQYLEPPTGQPTHDVLAMARRGLRMPIRTSLHRAKKDGNAVRHPPVSLKLDGEEMDIEVVVRPVGNAEDTQLWMVVFNRSVPRPDETPRLDLDESDPMVRQLEDELRTTRDHLRSTIEELETSNEELRSSNEELLAMNEELQSSNEELESSQEELRSVNEELETVNSELSEKVDELRDANESLTNLYQSTDVATVFLDEELRLKSYTPASSELLRLIPGDVGRPFADIAHRFEGVDLLDLAREVLDGESDHERELTANGGHYLLRLTPYVLTDEEIGGVSLTFTDITRVKAAESAVLDLNEKLARRLAELEAILASVPVGIAISTNLDCNEIRLNDQGAELLGVGPKTDIQLTDPDEASFEIIDTRGHRIPPHALPMLVACADDRTVEPEEMVIERADDTRLDVLHSAVPLRDESGHARAAVGVFVDISRQKAIRSELTARAAQAAASATLGLRAIADPELDGLMEAATEIVANTLDVDYSKVLELNRETESLLLRAGVGWKKGLVGQAHVPAGADSQAGYTLSVNQPVIVEDLPEESRFQGPALLTDHGVVSGLSVTIAGPRGAWGVFGAHTTEPRDFNEDDVHFLQTISNILAAAIERARVTDVLQHTERRLVLREAEASLQRSERLAALGTLAAGIAHEINNPINSILSTAELATEETAGAIDSSTLRERLESIMAEAERCGTLVRGVLRFGRQIETEEWECLDINQVVRQAAQLSEAYARDRKTSIALELSSGLPKVHADESGLVQVLLNLIQNGVEASSDTVRLEIRTSRDAAHVCVEVRDDGEGIGEEHLSRIFDPFFSTRRASGGTGLGLTISHAVIEDHEGEINVWSEPGKGTTFTVKLPIGDVCEEE